MPPLQRYELDDPGKVLCIVAHPDDLEYGAAAAVAMWTAAGHEAVYVLATSGEAGIDGIAPEECGPLREAEERAGAAVVGVHAVEFLGFPDGVVEYGVPLRRALARAIRTHKPDTIITSNHHATFAPGMLNQADHRAVGQACLEAVADAGNRWIFRDLLEEGLEPHKTKRVLIFASPLSAHGMDVTGWMDKAVASLSEHKLYNTGLGEDHPMSDPEMIRMFAETTALRLPGAKEALSFELYEFG
jgi:LmbE family N-acetylglucosaminyl deacetylase